MIPTVLAFAPFASIKTSFNKATEGQHNVDDLLRKQLFLKASLLVITHINDSSLELPSGNLAVEQDVELAVRAVLELRQEEVRRDPADERGAAPDVAALACHVPAGGVEHLGGEVDHGYLRNRWVV
jgi:hypothetical protein